MNVRVFGCNHAKDAPPIYVDRISTAPSSKAMDLLLLGDCIRRHYILIKEFDRLKDRHTKHEDCERVSTSD